MALVTSAGEDVLIPPLAREVLAASELVVGLDQYVDPCVRHLLRPGTRVLHRHWATGWRSRSSALSEARGGGSVALVSSGDVGVYAMASPVLEDSRR